MCVATGAIYTTTPPRAAKREAVEKAAESARDGAAEMINGKEKSPFYGINVYGSAPTFADADDDGDLDLVVGDGDGKLIYYRNVGTSSQPSFTNVGDEDPVRVLHRTP